MKRDPMKFEWFQWMIAAGLFFVAAWIVCQ